jgi:cytochrome c peroxidase
VKLPLSDIDWRTITVVSAFIAGASFLAASLAWAVVTVGINLFRLLLGTAAVVVLAFVVHGLCRADETDLAAATFRNLSKPKLATPQGITPTPEIVHLGKVLFFDPRLSVNGTIACADCHHPDTGYADPFPVALGLVQNQNGQVVRPAGTVNSPSVLNAAYDVLQFRNGRTNGRFATGTSALANQCLLPLANPIEMGQQTVGEVMARLRRIPGYPPLFRQAFGPKRNGSGQLISPVDQDRYAVAVATFESTLVSDFDSPIDRRLAGQLATLDTPEDEIGFQLCIQANCFSCHETPLFGSSKFANNGMEFAAKFRNQDQGRAAVPGVADVKGTIRAFKISKLRDLYYTRPDGTTGTSAPFGNSGAYDLDRVVVHYSLGGLRSDGRRDPVIDDRIVAQDWSDYQRSCVKAFLSGGALRSKIYPHVTRPSLP